MVRTVCGGTTGADAAGRQGGSANGVRLKTLRPGTAPMITGTAPTVTGTAPTTMRALPAAIMAVGLILSVVTLGVTAMQKEARAEDAATAGTRTSVEFDRRLRTVLQPIFQGTGARGMVAAVQDGDTVSIQGFGETRPGSGKTPDAASLVSVGSLSKVMASEVMAALVVEGKLHLTDPLQDHAPGKYRVPEVEQGRPITLLDLASHSSGLPRGADISGDGDGALELAAGPG